MENLISKVSRTFWEKLTGKVRVVYLDTQDRFLNKEFTDYILFNEYTHKVHETYMLRIIQIKNSKLQTFKAASEKVYDKALICGYTKFQDVYNEIAVVIQAEAIKE